MRLFLAIEIPQSVKQEIASQISELKEDYGQFDWVDPENFHITIVFLGEVISQEKIKVIKERIEEAIFDIEPFYLYSYGADLFLHNKLTLYLEFRREKKLEEIALKIKNSLHLEDDKKFVAHLSIARTRVPSKQQYLHLKKKLHRLPVEISFPVKKIFLFQSILEGSKPVYKKIAGFTLLQS